MLIFQVMMQSFVTVFFLLQFGSSSLAPLKEELADKEKIVDRQKRLAEQREFLKDKFKDVSDKKGTGNVKIQKKKDITADPSSVPATNNRSKTLPSDQSNNTGSNFGKSNMTSPASVTRSQKKLQPSSSTMVSSSAMNQQKLNEKLDTDCDTTSISTTPRDDVKLPSSSRKSPSSSRKPSKLSNASKKKQEGKAKNLKSLKKRPTHKTDSQFFSTTVMDDYFKRTGSRPFTLPKDEYQDLMNIKSSVETIKQSSSKLLNCELTEKESKKCFYQTTPTMEVKEDDGPIIDCHIDRQNLILIQRDSINLFERKEKKSKEWVFKSSMKRLRFSDIIREMIVSCNVNKKEMLVHIQVYVVKDEVSHKSHIKMAQYRFLEEKNKTMKEYQLGSIDW